VLECRDSGQYLNHAFGQGSGQILLDNVQCVGNETSLAECVHSDWGVHNCYHVEDVSISCYPDMPITGS